MSVFARSRYGAPRSRFRPLAWLFEADAAHQERRRLANLSDAQLRDVGLTRSDLARPGDAVWEAANWMTRPYL